MALDGGPAIVYSHEPSFTFELVEGSGEHPFHPQSPAGRFIKNNQDFFAKHNIFFSDPYQGRGGFGASTAQFIGCYLSLNSMSIPMMPEEIFKAVDVYCSLFSAEEVVPSGYDVAAQMGSGFAVINKQERNIDFVSWPFANVDLTLYKTNDKQNTHEHLKAVSVGDKASLRVAAQLVVKTFVQKDLPSFLQGLQLFSLALQKNNLIYSATENELKKITAQPNVLSEKPQPVSLRITGTSKD